MAIELYNEDNMQLMKRYPDKYFDIAHGDQDTEDWRDIFVQPSPYDTMNTDRHRIPENKFIGHACSADDQK